MTADEPLTILGDEQQRLDPLLSDGGLPPAVGTQSFCVFRSTRGAPHLADGLGYTYHHHVDIACWRGRLYVGWNSCEKDEDVWPSRELLSSSNDGVNWTPPVEMFPQGLSTPLRMYFYQATNGRMLLIAGLRLNTRKLSEDGKTALIVRELRDDHSLGDVFTLQAPDAPPHLDTAHNIPPNFNTATEVSTNRDTAPDVPRSFDSASAVSSKLRAATEVPPDFNTATDRGFVLACLELLDNTLFLEQQDRGRLLGSHRMDWHDATHWPGGVMPGTGNGKWVFGKALSLEQRLDGAWLGVCKMGWTIVSRDGGKTWSAPVIPTGFITGKAKAWLQRTRDGRFALVYNPSTKHRYPLVVVTSDDGVRFSTMRIVQGELPIQRYPGEDRSIGPQYCRGISRWSSDGSRDDDAMWLAYSMNKEDIWVSRVPLPVAADGPSEIHDDFAAIAPGAIVPGWNTYRPKWASIRIDGTPRELRLECSDPFDQAIATRCFHAASHRTVELRLTVHALRQEPAEIDLVTTFGGHRPVQVRLDPDGTVEVQDNSVSRRMASFRYGVPFRLEFEADAATRRFVVTVDGSTVRSFALAQPADDFQRLVIRTGPYRNIGGLRPVDPVKDVPTTNVSLSIARVSVR